jgi:hypothetical protein
MIYAIGMGRKTIPWDLIEKLLKERGKSREWLEVALTLEKNNISNWKKRGVPKSRVAEIATILNTTSDYLLGIEGAIKDVYANPHSDELVIVAKLVAIYSRLLPEEREDLILYAESIERTRAGRNIILNESQ